MSVISTTMERTNAIMFTLSFIIEIRLGNHGTLLSMWPNVLLNLCFRGLDSETPDDKMLDFSDKNDENFRKVPRLEKITMDI